MARAARRSWVRSSRKRVCRAASVRRRIWAGCQDTRTGPSCSPVSTRPRRSARDAALPVGAKAAVAPPGPASPSGAQGPVPAPVALGNASPRPCPGGPCRLCLPRGVNLKCFTAFVSRALSGSRTADVIARRSTCPAGHVRRATSQVLVIAGLFAHDHLRSDWRPKRSASQSRTGGSGDRTGRRRGPDPAFRAALRAGPGFAAGWRGTGWRSPQPPGRAKDRRTRIRRQRHCGNQAAPARPALLIGGIWWKIAGRAARRQRFKGRAS